MRFVPAASLWLRLTKALYFVRSKLRGKIIVVFVVLVLASELAFLYSRYGEQRYGTAVLLNDCALKNESIYSYFRKTGPIIPSLACVIRNTTDLVDDANFYYGGISKKGSENIPFSNTGFYLMQLQHTCSLLWFQRNVSELQLEARVQFKVLIWLSEKYNHGEHTARVKALLDAYNSRKIEGVCASILS